MIDLHSHSNASDGTLSPLNLLMLAQQTGIAIFSITDHDTLAGYLSLKEQQALNKEGYFLGDGELQSMRLISGVEISSQHMMQGGYGKQTVSKQSIHVVGLNFTDVHTMQNQLKTIQDNRASRAKKIVERLSELLPTIDIDDIWRLSVQKADNQNSLGRAHIAQALVELGVVDNTQRAFDKYLADGKSAYVALDSWSLGDTIERIHVCGGLAVLAHPTRYHLSATRVRKLIADFAQLGGDGCELPALSEPMSTRAMIDRCILANNLLASVGSDFHGATMPWRKLGQVPMLLEKQKGVWEHF